MSDMHVLSSYHANLQMAALCDYTQAVQYPMLRSNRVPVTCDIGFGCDSSKNAYK
jgi:hypothetical protein